MEVVHKSEGKINQVPTQEEHLLYQVLQKLPAPKKHFNLTKEQKYWWYWFGREFVSTKQFTTLDLIHLQKAAFWLNARNQAIGMINEKGYNGGLVQTFATGATNISGHVSIIEKADKHLEDVSSHFGLSFKDRNKLKMPTGDPAQLDMFELFLNKSAQ